MYSLHTSDIKPSQKSRNLNRGFLYVVLSITAYLLTACDNTKNECIAYRLEGGCDYVFFYDDKIRTIFNNKPEFANLSQFMEYSHYVIDTVIVMNEDLSATHTDSLQFVIDDIEETTCMKFGLSIHDKSVLSYVHYPPEKNGIYAYKLTEVEKNTLDYLIHNIIDSPSGIHFIWGRTSCLQIRLYGEYGAKEYIGISSMSETCHMLDIFRDFIITVNNRHVHDSTYVSECANTYLLNSLYDNEIVKQLFMPPMPPDELYE